jgi:hypothetical protein
LVVRDFFFNIFTAVLHIWRLTPSSPEDVSGHVKGLSKAHEFAGKMRNCLIKTHNSYWGHRAWE